MGTNEVGITIIILKTQSMLFLKSVRIGYTVSKMIKYKRIDTYIEDEMVFT